MSKQLRRLGLAGVLALLILAVGVVAYYALPATIALDRLPADRAAVTVVDGESRETLGTVDARVADTFDERYTGLSETESLADDEGMLFVHRDEGSRSYVMRNMSFPLDIVFVGDDRRISAIHHAPVPEAGGGDLAGYGGSAKWVLEVNRGWTTANDVSVGDRLEIEYGENASATEQATGETVTEQATSETTSGQTGEESCTATAPAASTTDG